MTYKPSSLTHRVARTFKTRARLRPKVIRNPTTHPRWFVVFTNPKCEERAQGGLEAIGYATFLPIMAKWAKIPPHRAKGQRNARERVERPLFPRYLFVGLDPDRDSFYPIRLTDGVADIINNNGAPIQIPDAVMARMMEAYERGDHDETVKEAHRFAAIFAAGQRVKITEGPFEGFCATIIAASKKTIVLETNDNLGNCKKIELPMKKALANLEGMC